MTRSLASLALLATTLLGAWVGVPALESGAAAEVRGVVRDTDARRLVGVRVELLADGRPLASAFTGPDGRFQLTARSGLATDGSLALRAERLGYADTTRILAADEVAGIRQVELVLRPVPLPLPGFTVEGVSEGCPARSHPQALVLWEAMSRRHPDGLDTLGAATYTQARIDTLASASRGRAAPEGLVAGQRGFSGRLRLAWERRLERDGYAFRVRRTDPSGSYDAWAYAPLEADFASHFGTELFTREQRLRGPTPSSAGGWILPFCAPDAERPGLEGHLELSGDTLLLRAEWRFRTPEPDEAAGGWTRFPRTPAGTPPLLLPLESVVWRTLRSGQVQRRAQWYESWTTTPGDSVPFLPARSGGPGTAPDKVRGVDPTPPVR
jgi:hypothetical protein